MNVSGILESRKMIDLIEVENKKLQTEINPKLEEIEYLRLEVHPIECQIESNQEEMSKLHESIKKELRDVTNLGTAEDDIEWLSLGCMENQPDNKCLELINFNKKDSCLESCNRKMVFVVDSVTESDFETMPDYPKVQSMIEVFKFTESEKFNPTKITELPYGQCVYCTRSGLNIHFTQKYLGVCIAIGDYIKFHYSDDNSPVMFECGNRRAYLMPCRKEA